MSISSIARIAALEIEADCLDRRGIKWEFAKVDDDVREEILKAWTRIIEKALSKAKGAQ